MTSEGIGKKKIYFRFLIIFCLLFLTMLMACGYFLKKGFQVEELTFGGVTISNSSVIWNKKLELEISEISLDKQQKTSTPQAEKNPTRLIGKGIEYGNYLLKVFSKLHIKNLKLGTSSIEIDLNNSDSQFNRLLVKSDDFSFSSDLTFKKDSLTIEIIEASSARFNTGVTGSMQLDGAQGKLSGDLTALINKAFPVAVHFAADKDSLSFSGKEAGEITEINSLVDLFGLRHGIQRWITDYLSGSRYHLKSFKGVLPWNNPKEILNTLEAEVTVDDTEYTFAPGLEPVKAGYTQVLFKHGVLDILPNGATFYGQDCGESWVDINFNDPKNILLTAYIKTTAVANDDILTLLNYYKIPLPFKQVAGDTATDLELAIILNKQQLEARGVFDIEDGVIEWGGKNHRVKNAHIKLVNSDVIIDRLTVIYDDLLTVQVAGTILAKQKTGDLDLGLEKMNLKLGESRLTIDKSKPLKASYHFDPTGHMIEAQASSWLLDTLVLELGSFKAPLDYNDLSLKVSKVKLGTPPGIASEISGFFSMKKMQADFTCDLLKFHVNDLKLKTPHIAIDITYDEGLFVTTEEIAEWELSKMPISLFPSQFEFEDDVFSVVSSRISYGELFDSYLAGYFNIDENNGRFSLEKIDVKSEDLEERLTLGQNVDVEINSESGNFIIFFPLFDLTISTDKEKNWAAKFGDLSAVYPRSKILQKYNIKEGKIEMSSKNGKKPYSFSADIKSSYPLLVDDDGPIDLLHITGQLTDKETFAHINEDLELSFADKKLDIKSHKIGYNLSAILQIIEELPTRSADSEEKSDETSPFTLKMSADQSHIYLGPKSSILADNMQVDLLDGKFNMKLDHGEGQLSFQLDKGSFVLDGKDLNDAFMGALIHNSKFQGGAMSIAAKGMLNEFSAVFEIKDTLLYEMATVNNVMAFLNTIPALVTFSLPEFDTSGFPIDSAVVGMKYKDKVSDIESLEVFSPEIYAKGQGTIDFSTKMIDMDINLKTQAGRNVGKIPVVGYVLAGNEDDESLNVKIEGHLDDPAVDHSLVKNIVVYPAEILYRTLKLPFHLGGKMLPESSGNKSSDGEEKSTINSEKSTQEN
ncbi:MAG: hypothetical protein ACI8PB_002258 [Desulforhopalus sp.]